MKFYSIVIYPECMVSMNSVIDGNSSLITISIIMELMPFMQVALIRIRHYFQFSRILMPKCVRI